MRRSKCSIQRRGGAGQDKSLGKTEGKTRYDLSKTLSGYLELSGKFKEYLLCLFLIDAISSVID